MPAEGARVVPMQFNFKSSAAIYVNFPNAPNAPMSQLASLFVDTTQCNNDVNILFPDTGYQVRVEAGGGRMIPVITKNNANTLNPFYVISDSGGATNSDQVTIQALNIFVPEFDSNILQKVLAFGYGQMFEPQPTFTQSTAFPFEFAPGSYPETLIPNMQWYITGIKADINTANTIQNGYSVDLLDAGVPFLHALFSTIDGNVTENIINMTGLNYVSSGKGPCTMNLSAMPPAFVIAGTIFGGVLVT